METMFSVKGALGFEIYNDDLDDTGGEERDDLEEACTDQESDVYDATSSNH